MDAIQFIGQIGGIAGVLVFLIFLTYRYLVKQMREDRQFMEDRLTGIISNYNDVCQTHTNAMIKHTQVLTELIVWLRAKNGG